MRPAPRPPWWLLLLLGLHLVGFARAVQPTGNDSEHLTRGTLF